MRPDSSTPTPTGAPAGVASSRQRGRRRSRWRTRRPLRRTTIAGGALVLAWLAMVGTRTLVLDWFAVPSASMEPTLQPGERILVDKRADDPVRGDVVVFDGASFGARDDRPVAVQVLGRVLGESPGQHLVKRVIGVGGDRVRCCDADGRLLVDDRPLAEPYLAAGDTPSDVRFDVTVPPGTLWVMGDHRSRSADSRSRLGSPGGGFVPRADVTGRVVRVVWPPGRLRPITAPPIPTTTGGHR
ncbi:signal peptidase I [Arsenicicoccus sp. oral taxon 190]|uniref:signal peptidase I n=1 Tax=Arsenicicoccus sp. oral taxon 190 TaxID=1658671 RepID=UPI000679FEB8|nr:signal peptidase I [Arsenicicoccus sp. oral taxon 190]AKT52239.1 hypothetical protein ADJ73_14915 [Arsenicicoccus sp. oral taxon 190]